MKVFNIAFYGKNQMGSSAAAMPSATSPGAARQFGSMRLIIIGAAFAGMLATVLFYDLHNLQDLNDANSPEVRALTIYTGMIMTHIMSIMTLALVLVAMLRQLEIKARLYPNNAEIHDFWQQGMNHWRNKHDDNPGAHGDDDQEGQKGHKER